MGDGSTMLTFRRTVLAASAASLAGLAGCSGSVSSPSDPATISRIAIRSYTGQDERVTVVLVYAPPDDSVRRPVRGIHKLNKGEGTTIIDDFSGEPGFYSLTVLPEKYNNAYGIVSFNSAVSSGESQFEVIIKESGNVSMNIGEAGSEVARS